MFLLRTTDRRVTDICLDCGFGSLGTFSRTFTAVVGESPSQYRSRGVTHAAPSCFAMAWTRPSPFTDDASSRPSPEQFRRSTQGPDRKRAVSGKRVSRRVD